MLEVTIMKISQPFLGHGIMEYIQPALNPRFSHPVQNFSVNSGIDSEAMQEEVLLHMSPIVHDPQDRHGQCELWVYYPGCLCGVNTEPHVIPPVHLAIFLKAGISLSCCGLAASDTYKECLLISCVRFERVPC